MQLRAQRCRLQPKHGHHGPSLCRFYCDACGMTEMEMKVIPKHPMFATDKAKALRDCMQCSQGMTSCKLRWFFFLQRILEISVLFVLETLLWWKDRLSAPLLKVVGYVNRVPLVLFKDEACVSAWPGRGPELKRCHRLMVDAHKCSEKQALNTLMQPFAIVTDQSQPSTTFPLKNLRASLRKNNAH